MDESLRVKALELALAFCDRDSEYAADVVEHARVFLAFLSE